MSSFQAALAWKIDHTLERVPSLCPTRQGNSLWRGMVGTLALRGLSTPPAEGHGGQLSSLRSGGGEAVSARGSSLAVLCVHYTAELVSVSLFMQCVHCITSLLY
jgi:hypothetical protein